MKSHARRLGAKVVEGWWKGDYHAWVLPALVHAGINPPWHGKMAGDQSFRMD